MAFGDLFLADIRSYREQQLKETGLEPLFPIWQIPTGELAREMIAAGLRARLVCVDPKQLDTKFTGREFDLQLLNELPPEVDPCGENGEFHSFVYGGPMFNRQLPIAMGEKVERDGFCYCDVLAAAILSS
jgi:diphthamide synthase (EF-2-diphthine--ammonia ligase)